MIPTPGQPAPCVLSTPNSSDRRRTEPGTKREKQMSEQNILVYGVEWCGDCRRARRFLNEHTISYTFINIDQDKKGEQFVLKVNRGYRSVPTIVFQDGSTLTEPSTDALARKLGIAEKLPQ
jgi:mycoredoxin